MWSGKGVCEVAEEWASVSGLKGVVVFCRRARGYVKWPKNGQRDVSSRKGVTAVWNDFKGWSGICVEWEGGAVRSLRYVE